MWASVLFNGTDLTGLTDISINEIDHHQRPQRILQVGKIARLDGNKLINAQYANKPITISGFIGSATRSAYETARDTLMQKLNAQEAVLSFSVGGATRQWTATVENIVWTENVGGFGAFSLLFNCSDGYGYDTSTTTLSFSNPVTTATSTQAVTFAGSGIQFPRISVTVGSVTDTASQTMTISNPLTGFAAAVVTPLNGNVWQAGDVMVLDTFNKTCTVNGTTAAFTGTFMGWDALAGNIAYADQFSARSVTLAATYTKRYL